MTRGDLLVAREIRFLFGYLLPLPVIITLLVLEEVPVPPLVIMNMKISEDDPPGSSGYTNCGLSFRTLVVVTMHRKQFDLVPFLFTFQLRSVVEEGPNRNYFNAPLNWRDSCQVGSKGDK